MSNSTTPTLVSATEASGQSSWSGSSTTFTAPPHRRSDSIPYPLETLEESDRPTLMSRRSSSRAPTFAYYPKREPTTARSLDDMERALHGYPRLATYMATEPGAAMYRRFASLNARILLYRQAQIVCLEHELDSLEQENCHNRTLHHSIKELLHAPPGTAGHKLWEKVSELETAIESYNTLLLQQKSLYELPSANDIDINDLNNFIHNVEMGGRWLRHPEDTIWDTFFEKGKYKAEQKDLVRLSGDTRYLDPFTEWLWGPCLNFFHRIWSKIAKPDDDAGGYSYNQAGLNSVAKAASMSMASLLPTCSIIALYFITNNIWRLIFILIFSVVFTAALSFFTAATRIEIFLASVGLASVQAVFVGNLIGYPGQGSCTVKTTSANR